MLGELREPKTREEIETFLDDTKGEREAHQYLRGYPDLVCWTFVSSGGHSRYVFSDFPLGSRYVADLVVLWCYSGAWKVHYIELEPVDDPIVNKDGTPGKRLRGAGKQIADWRHYASAHPMEVRADLARYAKGRDLLGYFDADVLSNFSGNYLSDPNTVLLERFHIVIGRSKKLTPDAMTEVRKIGDHAEITTYDRFVNVVAERQAHRQRQGLQ